MTALISKTTQTGKALIITLDGSDFVATLDGTEVVRSWQPGAYVAAQKLHILGGKVGLTKAEGAILIAAHQARVNTTVATASRADLVSDYHALIAEQASAYERAHNRQDARAMGINQGYDAKIEAAAQAIRDYDASHADETDARNAARAERVASNRWM